MKPLLLLVMFLLSLGINASASTEWYYFQEPVEEEIAHTDRQYYGKDKGAGPVCLHNSDYWAQWDWRGVVKRLNRDYLKPYGKKISQKTLAYALSKCAGKSSYCSEGRNDMEKYCLVKVLTKAPGKIKGKKLFYGE